MENVAQQAAHFEYVTEYIVRAGKDYRAKSVWIGSSLVKAIFEFSKARTSGKYPYVVLESHSE